jgi:hypothetical protein
VSDEGKSKRNGKASRLRLASPDFVSIREVAAYCCVDESTVSRGAKKKTWPFHLLRRVEIGGRVIFTRTSFSAMCRAMRTAAEALPADVASIEEGRRKTA